MSGKKKYIVAGLLAVLAALFIRFQFQMASIENNFSRIASDLESCKVQPLVNGNEIVIRSVKIYARCEDGRDIKIGLTKGMLKFIERRNMFWTKCAPDSVSTTLLLGEKRCMVKTGDSIYVEFARNGARVSGGIVLNGSREKMAKEEKEEFIEMMMEIDAFLK